MRTIILSCALLIASLGGVTILSPSAGAAETERVRITTEGERRSYYIYYPSNNQPVYKPYPIIMMLHGGFSSGRVIDDVVQFQKFVDPHKIIVVYPNSDGDNWNDGRSETSSEIDDVQYLKDVISDVAAKYQGDPSRVYLAGISNGGMMTMRMACDAADSFGAFATVIANMPQDLVTSCNPGGPVSFLMVQGTEDGLVPYEGGQVERVVFFLGGGDIVVSAPETYQFWVDNAGCTETNETETINTVNDGSTVTKIEATCPGDTEVIQYRMDGAGHHWPGGDRRIGRVKEFYAGPRNNDIDATDIIFHFFRRHGLLADR